MTSVTHTGTSCSECKKGGAGYEYMTTAGTGAEELNQCNVPSCPAGRYSDSKTKNCETCPVGQYQGDKMQTSCIQCPDGKSTTTTGQTHVSACGARCYRGFYKSASHPFTCSECPIGQYQTSVTHRSTSCTAC